jgi:hypothetical protein
MHKKQIGFAEPTANTEVTHTDATRSWVGCGIDGQIRATVDVAAIPAGRPPAVKRAMGRSLIRLDVRPACKKRRRHRCRD